MQDNAGHLGLVLIHFNIKQKDAAAAVGVDPAMITRWKNGTERLGVDSPRMSALIDYILTPTSKLTESDIRWLRARFAEEGIDTRFTDATGLRNALANYLSNDGSRVGEEELGRQRLLSQDFFALGGLDDITRMVDEELRRLPEGRTFMLQVGYDGIALEPAFVSAVARAVQRGVRLHLLVEPYDAAQTKASVAECYLPQMILPDTRVRIAAGAIPTMASMGLSTTLFVPNRICLHMGGGRERAPYVACAVRRRDYLVQAQNDLELAWGKARRVFEDLHLTTPRSVSAQMSAFYESGGLLVATDGLNPIFMSPHAFDDFLSRRGTDAAERDWRVEAFTREQAMLERSLSCGATYREMTTAVELDAVRASGTVAVYGQTFFDARRVDVRCALDILQGYLRFATLYPGFGIRFGNPCEALSQGMWMLSPGDGTGEAWDVEESPIPNAIPTTGLVVCMPGEGIRYLVSHDARFLQEMAELYEDTWGRFRFRIWHDGRLDTGQDDGTADASRSVYFIRERIKELEGLLA